MDNRKCSNCGGRDTEQVDVQFYRDVIEEIRVCNNKDCGVQLVNQFEMFNQEVQEL